MKTNEELTNLISFWDTALKMDEEYRQGIKEYVNDDNWNEFAPSPKLLEALKLIKDKDNVLDYGCGNAWATLALAKMGAKNVKGVDTSKEGISSGKFLLEIYSAKAELEAIDEYWLNKQKENQYDAAITSNVLDVLPIEVSKDIIIGLHNILKKDATLIVGLNYYVDPKIRELKDGKYLYVDGVLRLLSLSDDEWKELFAPYFDVVSLSYFSWPGEAKEARRLFVLKNK